MNKISVALTAIMLLCLAAYMAPNILALNRGKVLRNIALWLAIFAGLGLIYQNFIIGRSAGTPMLFGTSQPHEETPAPSVGTPKIDDSHGFTPPSE